jgi:hypothetical protein
VSIFLVDVVGELSDPLDRIRPLINILKANCSFFVIPGRDLSLDETSIAAKTRYGRHLVVFNPTKPGGKYHFRYYVLCTADNWICLDLKIHSHSTINHRLVVRIINKYMPSGYN